MAKKRVNITITDETKERILQYAQENHLQGGLSGAIEHIAWQVLKVKNAQSKGQTSNKWHTVIKGTKTIDELVVMNKCDVMERAVNKGKEEVREEERINSIKVLISSLEEFGISSEDIIEKVMEKFNFSRDEATKYVNK